MKNILITGANSYVGTSFETWLSQWSEFYKIDTIGTRDNKWKEANFSSYDVVFHVAGIAHQDTKKDDENLYYKVNRDLAIEVAKQAKNSGVKQFIFMSSMIVYGESNKVGCQEVITKNTEPNPANFYGNSKLLAEKGIIPLQSKEFQVAILRPPMIYGPNSKGNYATLSNYAKFFYFFPSLDNNRSMIYIYNFCELVRLIIDHQDNGVFHPQNKEYVSVKNMITEINKIHNRKTMQISLFNSLLKKMGNRISIINKIFGNFIYDKKLSIYTEEYNIFDFKQSILHSESEVPIK